MTRAACLLPFLLGASLTAATYHVRTDGGDATQCTGTVDAPYPGSGSNQPCAWSHPFWALDGSGAWKISGGDTLLIGGGSYRMGFGAPNSGWCDAGASWDCHLPPLPSGPSTTIPTVLAGAGWDSGCGARPELWGAERADWIVDLRDTDRAVVACLEITDHSGCVEFHANASTACERDTPPYGDWAPTGIMASGSTAVTLRDLDIHGLGSNGVLSGGLSDWLVDRVRIAGNGGAGWNGDIGTGSSNSGTLAFRRFTVEWNGCAETWPGEQPDHCWAQQTGGYGDGVGTASTGGDWSFEDSLFQYNTSDGLDMLYVGVSGQGGSVSVNRTIARGNAGNQLKVAASAEVVNSLLVGNCAFFEGKPFAQEMVPGDHCRAAGNALALSPHQGDRVYVVNSTIGGQGDCLVEIVCETGDCDGSEVVDLQNNVFRGDVDWGAPPELTCFMYYDALIAGAVTNDWNVMDNARDDSGDCPAGADNLCNVDPMLVNVALDAFDGHLQPGSPAIDSGLPVGSIGGRVPPDDLDGGGRPVGSGVDRGAYEWRASVEDYVAGEGLGAPNPNRVRLYTAGGSATGVDFLAYLAGQWGTNVASAELDGIPLDEILTGPGPGTVYGPQARGFFRDGSPMGKVNFFAYGTLRYGVNVGSGEIDGDAWDEILTGAGPGEVFGPHVRGFNVDGGTLSAISKVSFFAYGTLRYGVNVEDGDLEGDGFDEIVTGAGPGQIFGAQVRAFDYDGALLTAIGKVNFIAFAALTYGVNVAGGDVDADGFAEMAATPGPGPASSYTSEFRGFDYDGSAVAAIPPFVVTPFSTHYGGRVGLHDMQGDGRDELLAAPGRDPAATGVVSTYRYDGTTLLRLSSYPFTTNYYGVNVTGGSLGY